MRNALIVLPFLAMPLTALANTSVVVNVTGHLYAPTTCSLTTPPTVVFGDVLTTDVDKGDRVQPIEITLSCQDRNPLQSVMVQVDASGGSGNLIPVSGAKGLELALKKDGSDQNLGTPVKLATGMSMPNSTPVPLNARRMPRFGSLVASAWLSQALVAPTKRNRSGHCWPSLSQFTV